MASGSARTLSRWGLVALTGGLGCATGTQGDGAAPGEGGSTGSAGTFSSPETSGTGGEGVSGSAPLGGSTSTFGGFTNAGTFATGGTFSTAGTLSASGSGGTSSGGSAGTTSQGGAAGTSAGAGGKAGSGGTAGAGGKAGSGCASTKLAVSAATGTEERADLGPEFAIDGDMVTRWASEKTEPQTLDLDLGEVVTVNRVVINWEAAYATNYQLQIASSAAGPFTTIYTDAAGNGGTDDVTTLTVSDGRFLRMNGITRKTTYGFSIYEIAVYGDKDETCK